MPRIVMENTQLIQQFAGIMRQIKIFENIIQQLSDNVNWIKELQNLMDQYELNDSDEKITEKTDKKDTIKLLIANFQGQIKLLFNLSMKQMKTVKNGLRISKDLDHARLLYLIKKTKSIQGIFANQLLKKKICKEKQIIYVKK